AKKSERRGDILATGGVHIGGTDFDKYLSLSAVMPLLGYGSRLSNNSQVPSSYYFNLSTWHTINQAYTKKIWVQLADVARDAREPDKLGRLQKLIDQRAGHWLAMKVEEGKIALSDASAVQLELDRLSPAHTLTLERAGFDDAIGHLVATIEQTVLKLLADAGLKPDAVDTVFFTGGSSGVRLLREKIAALVPSARRVEGDLFGSIGAGLALDAVRKFG
ncbi:MAG TPA: Hsp70 family protein, partial [Janthinobacterium sp.]|nr:Hsp70 family protein [Janthinobacterium sp.]